MKKYDILIFDLDGTILDTSPGILNSVRYAEKQMNFQEAPIDSIKSFLGPPPKTQYQRIYGVDEKQAAMATTYHRQYGREKGMYEAEVYDGIIELLQLLKMMKKKTAVATLKRKDIAQNIMSEFKLSAYFDIIEGMDDEETLSKADIIRMVCSEVNTDISKAVLIGDSNYDAIGAKDAGVDFIGVTYGYGFHTKQDVKEYDSVGICETIGELIDFVKNI